MAISERVRREVLARDRGFCQLFHKQPVPATEIAHIRHQGMGGDSPDAEVNQPDNLISVCSECHRKLHGPGIPYQIVRWEPEDPEGLEVVDPEGRRVPHDRLWFYVRGQWEQAEKDISWLRGAISSIRGLRWGVAQALARLKESGGYRVGEYSDIYELGLDFGLPSAEVKRLIRAAKFAEEMGLDMTAIDPEIADALRRVPEEDLVEVAGWFRDHPLPEAWRRIHDKYGTERMRTFRKFRPVQEDGEITIAYEEIKARSEDEVPIEPGEVVVRGGSVIAGIKCGGGEE